MASLVRHVESSQAVTYVKKSFEDHPKKTILQCLLIIGALGTLCFARSFPWPARIGVAAGTMFLAIAMEALKRPSLATKLEPEDPWLKLFNLPVSKNAIQALSGIFQTPGDLSKLSRSLDCNFYDSERGWKRGDLTADKINQHLQIFQKGELPILLVRNTRQNNAGQETHHPMLLIFVKSSSNEKRVIAFGEDPTQPGTWKDVSSIINPQPQDASAQSLVPRFGLFHYEYNLNSDYNPDSDNVRAIRQNTFFNSLMHLVQKGSAKETECLGTKVFWSLAAPE